MVSSSENKFGSPTMIAMRLAPPRLASDSVERKRLLQIVCGESVPTTPLCLVTAPAGYGTTTFLAQCQRQLISRGMVTAWLTLDEEHNEQEAFLFYLSASFAQWGRASSESGADRHLTSVDSSGVRRWISELLGALDSSQNYALFLDNYHQVENPQVHGAIQYLLKQRPDNLYLFIGSRSLPPIPLARLRAAGGLIQLDSSDLGFDQEETATLLRDTNHLQVSTEEVALLQTRTGGWAAVLQLAALSMRGATDRHRFVSAFSADHASVSDFLAEEVLAQIPVSLAEFLRRIAILDRFCGPLCAAVSGDQRHSRELSSLRDSRLLVQALDEIGYWYRLHPLLRNFLLRQLSSAEGTLLIELHRRASHWFEEEGLIAEAIQHAISAGDENRALGLLDDHGVSLIAQGYLSDFLGLIRRLPEVMLRQSLGVLIQLTWLPVLSNQVQQGQRMLDELKVRMDSLDLAQQVEVYCMEATLYTIDDQVEKARELTDTWMPQAPREPVHLRPTFRLLQGFLYYHRREFSRAQVVAKELIAAPTVPDLMYNQTYACCLDALICLVGARLKQGVYGLEHQLQQTLRDVMPGSQLVALLESMLGVLQYYRGDLAQAEKLFQRGLAAQRGIATVDLVIAVVRAHAQLLYQQKRYDALFDYLRQAEQLADARGWKRLQACLTHERVRILVTSGEVAQARTNFDDWERARKLLGELPEHTRLSIDYWTCVAHTRLLLGEGDPEGAEQRLRPVLREFLQSENRFRAMELQLLLARIRLAADRTMLAKQSLSAALSLDAEYCAVQLFRDEGQAVMDALREMRRDIESPGKTAQHQLKIQQIKGIVGLESDEILLQTAGVKSEATQVVNNDLAGDLTRKELATLALLVEGYSNKEISEKLCVSINTVKTHLKSAYAKLDVSRRTQAVRTLKHLGIFK